MFVRVYSGAVKPGDTVLDSTKGKKERIGKIFQMHADKENPVDAAERRQHLHVRRPEERDHR